METIMNDNDSKAFLKEMARLYPKYKNDFGAVSNLIVLLMEELQEEREGRKHGGKFEAIVEELEKYHGWAMYKKCNEHNIFLHDVIIDIKQKYFPEPKEIDWKDKFYELEEEFEERERELIHEIEHWKFEYHKKGE